MKFLFLAQLIALISLSVAATESPELRGPGSMTESERGEMMSLANAYNQCVYDTSISNLDVSPDIRAVADFAMGECSPQLELLESKIIDLGFETYFAEGFSNQVRTRAVRKLLPELAVRKSR
ncbi:MAG: hypothetical protein AAF384_04525 [Pseudomonadota bacterium]